MATTLRTPGMTATAKIQRSGTSACTRTSATRGPRTAPIVSMVRCRPNARPCCPGLCVGRDEVVPRRRPHPLAEAVGEAAGEGQRPAGGQGDDELAEGAEAVAAEHEGSAATGVVGGLPEGVLGDARGGFGDALDQAEQRDRGAEDAGHEDREQRVGDLRAQVGEHAHQAEPAHVRVEGAQLRDPAAGRRADHGGLDASSRPARRAGRLAPLCGPLRTRRGRGRRSRPASASS